MNPASHVTVTQEIRLKRGPSAMTHVPFQTRAFKIITDCMEASSLSEVQSLGCDVISRLSLPSSEWLGFNIIGGTDHRHFCNDSAIYVTKIKEDGPAALDGRLKEQDQILAINGRELCNLTHQEAVEIFRNAGDEVTLLVLKKIKSKNNQIHISGFSSLVLTALGISVLAMVVYMKYRHRL